MIKNAVFTPARLTFLLSAALLAGASAAHADDQNRMLSNQPQPPDVRLGPLFNAVQQAKFYPDQKTFADAVPKSNPSSILADWQMQKNATSISSILSTATSRCQKRVTNMCRPPGKACVSTSTVYGRC